MSKNIPTYSLNDSSKNGLFIDRIVETSDKISKDIGSKGIHRDNHYLFLFLESGKAEVMVDFKTYKAEGPSVFCIMPGQVHYSESFDICGWFLGVNSDLVTPEIRTIFEESLLPISPIKIDENFAKNLGNCAQLLYTFHHQATNDLNIAQSLLYAYTTMLASAFKNQQDCGEIKEIQALKITRQFRILIKQQFKTLKSPSSYAKILNISPSYLTEVVKEITGKPTGYWIQQEIIIEAKRLLYYTDMTVKEIANELGYQDYAYFSRIFSKIVKQSAVDFKKRVKLNSQNNKLT
jgi:AraC family transcriptional regulator, transcriptional activator of pobA